MKGVFVVLDGVADEGCHSLGGRTPLEAARTPYLNLLASRSRIDHSYVIKEGVAPESSNAIVSLLGYDPALASRGPLEALGAGVKISRGDLIFRTNFATIADMTSMALLDRRAGRTLSTKEAQILAQAINEKVKLPYKFHFQATVHHRGVLVFKGGFSDNVSNIDPHYGSSRVAHGDVVPYSKPLDDDAESKLAADMVNQFVRKSHEVLDVHPLNVMRAKKGLYSANFVLCRDPGNELVRFPKLKGSWMGMVYMPLEIGIARAAKMDIFSFPYPPLKGIDVYANLYAALELAVKRAVKMIKRYQKKYDYFFIHFKETDVPGHDNKPHDKVRMIELIDRQFFSFLQPLAFKQPLRVVLTADHTTSCRLKEHSDKPVPVLFYDSHEQRAGELRFIESDGLKGRSIPGRKVLERTLFS